MPSLAIGDLAKLISFPPGNEPPWLRGRDLRAQPSPSILFCARDWVAMAPLLSIWIKVGGSQEFAGLFSVPSSSSALLRLLTLRRLPTACLWVSCSQLHGVVLTIPRQNHHKQFFHGDHPVNRSETSFVHVDLLDRYLTSLTFCNQGRVFVLPLDSNNPSQSTACYWRLKSMSLHVGLEKECDLEQAFVLEQAFGAAQSPELKRPAQSVHLLVPSTHQASASPSTPPSP